MRIDNEVYVSVVIPVFNEEHNLNELYIQLNSVLRSLGRRYEIIFVDDGSRDRSIDILRELQKSDENIRIISFCRNFGQHAAVMAGFKIAKGEIIVTLDADLQNPPDEIPKLINKVEEGFDVVAGRRLSREDKLYRRLPSFFMNKIISKLTGTKLNDYGCMLRAYRKTIVNYLLSYGEKSVYIPAFTSWLSSNIAEVPVNHNPRKHGKSKYNFLRLLRQCFDLITAYTLFPIQLISIVGAILSILGVFLACYLISFRLFFGTPSSLTTFISALLFFSGIVLFSIGVISEYLARIYIETRKMPFYIIKEEFNQNKSHTESNTSHPGKGISQNVRSEETLDQDPE